MNPVNRRVLCCLLGLASFAACQTTPPPLPPLLLRGVSTIDGPRFFRVHVPQGPAPQGGWPVLLAFHGGGGNARQFAQNSRLQETADREGILLVFPEGTPAPAAPPFTFETWNAGDCCGAAHAQGVDDVAFVAALLDALEAEFVVDPHRVHATGLSNGGMMSYRLAIELVDRLAAVAPVACALQVQTAPVRPLPIMPVHGALDANVPWQGGVGIGPSGVDYRSQEDSLLPFLSINQGVLPADPVRVVGQALYYEAPSAITGATTGYWWLLDQGHSWPGAPAATNPGEPFNTDLDINAEIWSFFAAHPRTNRARTLPGGQGGITLRASLPIVGRDLSLEVSGAPSLVTGEVWFSAPAPPTLVGGAVLWLEPTSAAFLLPLATDLAGEWSTQLPITPPLAFLTYHLQALIQAPNGPLLGDGLRLHIAY